MAPTSISLLPLLFSPHQILSPSSNLPCPLLMHGPTRWDQSAPCLLQILLDAWKMQGNRLTALDGRVPSLLKPCLIPTIARLLVLPLLFLLSLGENDKNPSSWFSWFFYFLLSSLLPKAQVLWPLFIIQPKVLVWLNPVLLYPGRRAQRGVGTRERGRCRWTESLFFVVCPLMPLFSTAIPLQLLSYTHDFSPVFLHLIPRYVCIGWGGPNPASSSLTPTRCSTI